MTFIIAEEMKNPKIKPILSKIKLLIESKQEQIQKALSYSLYSINGIYSLMKSEAGVSLKIVTTMVDVALVARESTFLCKVTHQNAIGVGA
mmetsp:Transcript_68743/g.102190  ORF Transcript_68743/g.102190 Transcript_68743/m.102190 type:complete len:91 (+) Transcript_68743:428-700(+)